MFYFLIYFFLEVVVTVDIAGQIGGLATFFEIIITAFIGLFLLTNFRYTLAQSMHALMSGSITVDEFQKMNLMSLLGAILLIIPGFFSDIVGLLLQFGFFGTFVAKKILHLKEKKSKRKGEYEDAIDVEIIDHDTIDK
ncbi:MAG TPA: FxsA family protein [Campylobacteraceae bacterium]|nr:FxsA family protein [Campylobacteraceae bacterium]